MFKVIRSRIYYLQMLVLDQMLLRSGKHWISLALLQKHYDMTHVPWSQICNFGLGFLPIAVTLNICPTFNYSNNFSFPLSAIHFCLYHFTYLVLSRNGKNKRQKDKSGSKLWKIAPLWLTLHCKKLNNKAVQTKYLQKCSPFSI